jgi:hypothetical protein
MLQGAANHARYRCNGFQHNCSMAISPGKKLIGKEAQKFDESSLVDYSTNLYRYSVLYC